MRVLVTGGAGFIGSHVVDALLGAGHKVFTIDNFSTGNKLNLPLHATPDFTLRDGTIFNDSLLKSAFSEFRPEAIVHLAAQSTISGSFKDPEVDLLVNAMGTLKLIQKAIAHGVQRFVFSSTSAVYKHVNYEGAGVYSGSPIRENSALGPDTPYGISKLAAEGYLRTLIPKAVILRFGNVIGPRQVPIGENQVLSRMIKHLKSGDEFRIHGSGNQKRDFVNVWDVALAVLATLESVAGTYNIASGKAYSVNEMAKIVAKRYGVEGYAWEHTKKEDPREYVCLDIAKSATVFNWEPQFTFEQTVNETIDWWEKK
jgi:UDP-glucose 4-epimerase